MVESSPKDSRVFYEETVSEESALVRVNEMRGDGWRVLAAPFLVDSKRVSLFRVSEETGESKPISSTTVEIWAFLLHRFFY